MKEYGPQPYGHLGNGKLTQLLDVTADNIVIQIFMGCLKQRGRRQEQGIFNPGM